MGEADPALLGRQNQAEAMGLSYAGFFPCLDNISYGTVSQVIENADTEAMNVRDADVWFDIYCSLVRATYKLPAA